jgi:hypothetical protein
MPSTFLFVTALQINPDEAAVLQDEISKRGLRLTWQNRVPGGDVTDLVGITVKTTATENSLDCAFSVARWSHAQRSTTQRQVPITIINCCRDVPPSVRADFFRYGCYVVSEATPEQIADTLDTALVDVGRRSRRGITFTFRDQFFPQMTYCGREEELPARGRLLSLLSALCRERREFSSTELGAILNCRADEVKVYVDRLRRLIVSTGRKLGTSIGKREVIQNSGRKGGYYLHASVGGRLSSSSC